MLCIDHLLSVADSYREKIGLPLEKTLSGRIFGDQKVLTGLRDGKEITVGRFNMAMRWFANHWPEGHPVPDALKPYVAVPAEMES
jgi:hypothetical protein